MNTITATMFGGQARKAPEVDRQERFDRDHQDKKKDSQATTIVQLAIGAGADLWHAPNGDSHISVTVDAHREHYPLNSRASKDYLSRLYFVDEGKAPNATALTDALNTLSGIARFDGKQHDVHVRVAGDRSRLYLDLGDPEWQAIEATAEGWRLISKPQVRFRRPRGVLPLPAPERGGSIADVRTFLNVATDDDFVLIVNWLLAALRPRGPYPILIFMAEQGAAKTTTTRVLRRLLDPNESDVRRPPRNVEDLMIAATNGHVVAFDNLSRLPEDLSDNLSVLATGGGFAVRQLYTNNEEAIFQAQRPIILNGISQVATRGDLLDRAIVVTLPPIPEHQRKDEATFWHDFDEARPRILGALLDAIVVGLQRVADVQLERKPRMADFAIWSTACEPACPWPAGTFLQAYAGNRQGAIEATLDGDPVVDVVRTIAPWIGTADELLKVLNSKVSESTTKQKDWFSRPRQVSDALRRLAPGLRRIGIDVTFTRTAHTGRRLIHLREEVGTTSSPTSPSSPEPKNQAVPGDEPGDASRYSSPSASPENVDKTGLRDVGDAGDAEKPLFSEHANNAATTEDDPWIDM